MSELTDAARYLAGKSQMNTFLSWQYPEWRVVAVRSIRKIILQGESFYEDILSDFADQDSVKDSVSNEIRNGWLFEAVSQAEQAIEDLFSLLKNSNDIAYFARDVVNYSAPKVKDYIWNFKTGEISYILGQFGLPCFPIDGSEPWENEEVYNAYKDSILLMQKDLTRLVAFHKKYYLDYCQYKHGMAVALNPFAGNKLTEDPSRNIDKQEFQDRNPLEGALTTFDSYSVDRRAKSAGGLPQIGLWLTEAVQPYVRSLHDEQNLLHYSMHVVDIDEAVEITEIAYQLESVVRHNLIKRSEITDEDKIREWTFPTTEKGKILVIGFPMDLSESELR